MDATLPLVTGRFPVDPSELLPGESLEVELSVSQVDEFYELLDLSKRRFAF